MTLNCKVGDLDIVVRSQAGNEGKIVRCVQVAGNGLFLNRNEEIIDLGPSWMVDRTVAGCLGNPVSKIPDSYLRPIRPLDEPETITTDDEVTA